HCFGPHGDIAGMCMRSHEFQIREGETGDFWSSDTIIDAEAAPSADPDKTPQRYKPGGTKIRVFDPKGGAFGRLAHQFDHEKPHGQWNQLDLVCVGQSGVHMVNGKVVLRTMNSRRMQEGREVPLTKGRFQLLSEGFEIYFRDLKLTSISEIPAAFKVK